MSDARGGVMDAGRRAAVVGDATSVAGFRPLGFATFVAEPPEAAIEMWPELVSGEYGAVFVTEDVFAALGALVGETADKITPAVTVISGTGSAARVGEERLARAIERALGTSVPFTEEEGS